MVWYIVERCVQRDKPVQTDKENLAKHSHTNTIYIFAFDSLTDVFKHKFVSI